MLLTARHWFAAGSALLVTGALSACAATGRPAAAANSGAPAPQCASGMAYARSELFFGKSIPGGGTVTDAAFTEFLNREVTPRFPDGFTVVPTIGQYRETNGVIDHEASSMVIFFYRRDSAGDASKKLDEIRTACTAYTKAFRQESVLRDDEQPACVAFR